MKTRILISLSFLTLLFSCLKEEELSPNANMEGKWEQIFEVNGLFEGYHILEFKQDGTFTGEMMARKLGTGEIIGYRGVFNGSYEVNGEKLTLTEEVLFTRDFDDPSILDDNVFVPKEALIPNSNTSEIYYRIANGFSELKFICPEGSEGECIEFTTYVKVVNP